MPSQEQKKRLLKAKIAVALHDELGRVPKEEEVNQIFLLTRVMYKAAIPAEPSSPVITVSAALAFRKHRCDNTP
jgi:hypothetical protein